MKREGDTPRRVFQMPFLLAATMGLHCAVVAVAAIFLISLPFGGYDVTVTDQTGDVGRFLLEVFVAMFLFGSVSGAVVCGLRTEQRWAREVIVLWCGLAAAVLFFSNAWSGQVGYGAEQATGPLLGLAFYGWYLYGKRSVRSYYRALAEARLVNVKPPMPNAEHSA